MAMEPDLTAYNAALVQALRSTQPGELRAFAATWGERLGNRGLRTLAKASDERVERRMWMMIWDRPDLADLHPQAEAWLASHPEEAT
jgi:hypothetical protein